MGRTEWVQLLSDNELKKYFNLTQDFEHSGFIPNEMRVILNTEYDQSSYLERAVAFCIDIWKEAAFRWIKEGD
jgi:hypothetical protein